MSKTVCVYHSIDLDGWMSAGIVKHWWQKEQGSYIQENNHITNPNTGEDSIDFIGYNYGQPIPDLSEYDKVIMCDISFPESEMYKLCITKDFIWNDHHASALAMYENIRPSLPNDTYYAKGLRGVQYAACELTWKYFFPNEPMPEIVRLLGRYDCFGHKGTYEEQVVLEFQYGARQSIVDYNTAYEYLIKCKDDSMYSNVSNYTQSIWSKGSIIYKYLCTEAKQVYKNGFTLNIGKSSIKLVDIATLPDLESETLKNASGTFLPYKFICINKERFNPINFGVDYHKDGYDGCACFYYADGMWNFSLYNDDGKVDCSAIAKQFGGGGHKGAAGFRLNNNEFLRIINK